MFPKVLKIQKYIIYEASKFTPYALIMNKQCYNLALELKEYLLSDYLITQFPILQLPDYMENTFALHVNIIQQRLVLYNLIQLNEKTSQSSKDANQLHFFLKTYVYSELANKYNDKYPADGMLDIYQAFSDYFIENYANRVEVMAPEIKILDNDMQSLQNDEIQENTKKFIRKYIFLHKIPITHNVIVKYSNYFIAHMNYLHAIPYNDLMQFKIYWGMQEELKQLNS